MKPSEKYLYHMSWIKVKMSLRNVYWGKIYDKPLIWAQTHRIKEAYYNVTEIMFSEVKYLTSP